VQKDEFAEDIKNQFVNNIYFAGGFSMAATIYYYQ